MRQVLVMSEKVKFERAIRKAGGAFACTIPPELMRAAKLSEGDLVDIYMLDDGRVVIEKRKRVG